MIASRIRFDKQPRAFDNNVNIYRRTRFSKISEQLIWVLNRNLLKGYEQDRTACGEDERVVSKLLRLHGTGREREAFSCFSRRAV